MQSDVIFQNLVLCRNFDTQQYYAFNVYVQSQNSMYLYAYILNSKLLAAVLMQKIRKQILYG